MESNAMTTPIKMSILFLLAMFIGSQSSQADQIKETSMTIYFQDRFAGPNATTVPITGIPGQLWTFGSFGTVFCIDSPITQGLEGSSEQIARGQGVHVTSALDGSATYVSISIVFMNKEFNGSTLEIQGANYLYVNVRELAVVGGTGQFRYARGFATFETAFLDMKAAYAVLRCNITVEHY
ncbi:unnamed protein product [Ilex paraguariensis]|uniref:Dirigent protein n=1 Tax=Ilex paraguariensis TaxID=185542 RepID=A0ABC8SS35_9AQUA